MLVIDRKYENDLIDPFWIASDLLLTLADKVTKKLSTKFSLKMAERSEAKKREAKLRIKNLRSRYFDAKLSFALLSLAALSHY